MRIDIHAHCFPGAYLDLLARHGDTSERGLAALHAGDGPDDVDARLELMDASEVQMQVLSLSSQGPYVADAAQATAAARLANDLLADLVDRHRERFMAFAVLPLPHMSAAMEELDRALALPGIVGVVVSSSIMGRSIVESTFEPLYGELDRRSAVLFVHPAGRAAESPLIESTGLAWPIGAPIEDTIAVTHLIARGIPVRYPNLKILNAHLGGAIAMLIARLDNQFPRSIPDAPEAPSLAVRRMWYDTVCHAHGPALLAADAAFGARQLILGTDYPFVRGPDYAAAVRFVNGAGLATADAEAILGLNGAALLGL